MQEVLMTGADHDEDHVAAHDCSCSCRDQRMWSSDPPIPCGQSQDCSLSDGYRLQLQPSTAQGRTPLLDSQQHEIGDRLQLGQPVRRARPTEAPTPYPRCSPVGLPPQRTCRSTPHSEARLVAAILHLGADTMHPTTLTGGPTPVGLWLVTDTRGGKGRT
jgi:hypothetical protein